MGGWRQKATGLACCIFVSTWYSGTGTMSFTLPSLLADMTIPGHEFGIRSETAAGSEAFVATTLGFLVFLFLGFALGGWVLWRRERYPAPHQKLLMELEEEEEGPSDPGSQPTSPGKHTPAKPQPKAWEREANWWQKE